MTGYKKILRVLEPIKCKNVLVSFLGHTWPCKVMDVKKARLSDLINKPKKVYNAKYGKFRSPAVVQIVITDGEVIKTIDIAETAVVDITSGVLGIRIETKYGQLMIEVV